MHFIQVGASLPNPVELDEAVSRAIYGKPSADTHLFANEAGDLAFVHPWKSEDEARHQMALYGHGIKALHAALGTGELRSYALNPAASAWVRIPRFYWFSRPISHAPILEEVEGATGFDVAMIGQPIVTSGDELTDWERIASAALEPMRQKSAGVTELVVRRREPSKRELALRKFLAWYDGLENPIIPPQGQSFYLAYGTFCAKQTPKAPTYGRSAFYETLKKIRQQSGIASDNDNAKDG